MSPPLLSNTTCATVPLSVKLIASTLQTVGATMSAIASLFVFLVMVRLGRGLVVCWDQVIALSACDFFYALIKLLWRVLKSAGALTPAACKVTMPLYMAFETMSVLWTGALVLTVGWRIANRDVQYNVNRVLPLPHCFVWAVGFCLALVLYSLNEPSGSSQLANCEYIDGTAPVASRIPHPVTLMSCAFTFGCMGGYMITVVTDPHSGGAGRRRNVRRFEVYSVVSLLVWACRLIGDFVHCPAYPGPGYLFFWMIVPVAFIGCINVSLVGRQFLLKLIPARGGTFSEWLDEVGRALATGAVSLDDDQVELAAIDCTPSEKVGEGARRSVAAALRSSVSRHVRFGGESVVTLPPKARNLSADAGKSGVASRRRSTSGVTARAGEYGDGSNNRPSGAVQEGKEGEHAVDEGKDHVDGEVGPQPANARDPVALSELRQQCLAVNIKYLFSDTVQELEDKLRSVREGAAATSAPPSELSACEGAAATAIQSMAATPPGDAPDSHTPKTATPSLSEGDIGWMFNPGTGGTRLRDGPFADAKFVGTAIVRNDDEVEVLTVTGDFCEVRPVSDKADDDKVKGWVRTRYILPDTRQGSQTLLPPAEEGSLGVRWGAVAEVWSSSSTNRVVPLVGWTALCCFVLEGLSVAYIAYLVSEGRLAQRVLA